MAGKLKSVCGYTMAVAAIVIVLVAFIENDQLALVFARLTGITVSPRYTGGEVTKTIDHGTYKTFLHRPVFDGLFSDRSRGFIQINWYGEPPWPQTLEESVDCDGDGVVDFVASLDTGSLKANLSAKNPSVTGVENTYRLNRGFAMRIALQKKP